MSGNLDSDGLCFYLHSHRPISSLSTRQTVWTLPVLRVTHLKALPLAPSREGAYGVLIAYPLEVSEPDELPRAFEVVPGIDVGGER